jgi:small subunit ribosomal protein S19e
LSLFFFSLGTRELPPWDVDWYYVRAASIARKLYLNPGLGVGQLATWYGKAGSTGRPQKFQKASRAVLRHILIQMERIGLVEKISEKGGRRLTSAGQKDCDTIVISLRD